MSLPPKGISGPKGLLRVYILHKLSTKQMSGYDLISELDSVTGGSWHPGSGSIYPILEDLGKKKLIEVVSKGHRAKRTYGLTRKGEEAVDDAKKTINQFATKWNKIRLTFMDLVNADKLSTLVLDTTKANRSAWQRVLDSKELPKNEAKFRLKEYVLLLDNEARWANEQLRALG